MTAEEVAERLKVKVETLRQWRWLGKGPKAIKVGGRFVRYRPADVNHWIAAHDRKAGAPPAA
jgi:excisionase family DNA binding protein